MILRVRNYTEKTIQVGNHLNQYNWKNIFINSTLYFYVFELFLNLILISFSSNKLI